MSAIVILNGQIYWGGANSIHSGRKEAYYLGYEYTGGQTS